MKLHTTTLQRVRQIQHDALADLEAELAQRSTRPTCAACGKHGPTIDGYCVPHMSLQTQTYLHTSSAEDILRAGTL
jgi:hypothetical protein